MASHGCFSDPERFLHRYRGSMGMSVLLAMLFGVLHWAPLARQPKA